MGRIRGFCLDEKKDGQPIKNVSRRIVWCDKNTYDFVGDKADYTT